MKAKRRIAALSSLSVLVLLSASCTPGGAGHVRTYYIAADEVDWDYAPSGSNGITGAPFSGMAVRYMEPGPGRVGRRWHKAVYH